MEELKKIIQQNILDLMEERNLSARRLSADMNLSESYAQKLLNGTFVPKLDKLLMIAEYFNVPIWRLFLSPELATGKLQEIETYLLTFDEATLDATLNLVSRIQPNSEK